MKQKIAVIIGAGPAGLTAAYELLTRTDIKPIVLEETTAMGGLSRTVNYKGNKIDIGGHRFFSKSDRVMKWWFEMLPIQDDQAQGSLAGYRCDPTEHENIMLVRKRKSRIFFARKFFDYPLKLSVELIRSLGLLHTVRIGFSYLYSCCFPIKNEENLEQFFINRFGRELYKTFFKSYTEKVWGVPCSEISTAWGAQRIKGLSVGKALLDFVKKTCTPQGKQDLAQKNVETSLIDQFAYPKYGPGQMWQEVAKKVTAMGGQIITGRKVTQLSTLADAVTAVEARCMDTGVLERYEGDYFFSTMPVKDLIAGMSDVPVHIQEVANGLPYRDFLTVGLLLKKLRKSEPDGSVIKDNWIYIQEPDVMVGRLQIFNNWSPYMVADERYLWVGLEYFCYEGDELWSKSDDDMKKFAIQEMIKMGMIEQDDVLDATVIKSPKAYPAYFGTYEQFDDIKAFLSLFENLFLVGRNGMHRYNNQDHSMLAAMQAVDNIASGITDQSNIWHTNTEKEYHETKQG